jgi:hypothetical protein
MSARPAARPRASRRDPVRIAGWWLRWAAVPAALGIVVSGNVDARSLPFIGAERETAVLLLDGQAYFGHLDDSGESGALLLRDVYYFQDAKGAPTNIAVSIVKRGGEAHEPADGMRINRDRVLAIERVGAESAVRRAIAVERALLGTRPSGLQANPPIVAGSAALDAQRVAAEHGIARGFATPADQLTKITTELVLPIPKAEAAAIAQKALDDLRTIRRNALAALGATLGMSAADADAYARATDPSLEGQSFANDPGVLLAPDLNAIVVQAAALYAQVGDAAAKQLTSPRGSAAPTPSAVPSRSPVPPASPSPSPRP